MHDCLPLLQPPNFPAIRRGVLDTVQVNLGYRCNLSCLHCHVGAGPARKESMARLEEPGYEDLAEFLAAHGVEVVASLPCGENAPPAIGGFDPGRLASAPIATADHCYGCTAGAGSGCGGELAATCRSSMPTTGD